MIVLRPLPLPNPYGQLSVSPWITLTAASSTPSSSATICAMAVSFPEPGVVVPPRTVTRPVGLIRTVEVSKPPVNEPGRSAPSGVSSNAIPRPTVRPASRAPRLLLAQPVVVGQLERQVQQPRIVARVQVES